MESFFGTRRIHPDIACITPEPAEAISA